MEKKPKAQPKAFNTVKYCDRDMHDWKYVEHL